MVVVEMMLVIGVGIGIIGVFMQVLVVLAEDHLPVVVVVMSGRETKNKRQQAQ